MADDKQESSMRDDILNAIKGLVSGGLVGKAKEALSGQKSKNDKAIEEQTK